MDTRTGLARLSLYAVTASLVFGFAVPSRARTPLEPAIAQSEAWLLGQQSPNDSLGGIAELAPRDAGATVLALTG